MDTGHYYSTQRGWHTNGVQLLAKIMKRFLMIVEATRSKQSAIEYDTQERCMWYAAQPLLNFILHEDTH